MYNRYLQQHIVFGRLSLPFAIIISVVLVLFVPEPSTSHFISSNSTSLWSALNEYISLDSLTLRIINLATFCATGLFLLLLNNAFTLIRVRSTIPATLFFLMFACGVNLHSWQPSSIVVLLTSLSLYYLMKSYQQRSPMGNIYHAWGLLGLASLLFPDLLLILPIYLIGEYMFQSLSLKSFFAGIIGVCVPYLLAFSFAFIFNMTSLTSIYIGLINNISIFNFECVDKGRWLLLGLLTLMDIISIIHLSMNSWKDKIRTRDYLFFLIWLTMFLLAFIIIRPQNFDIYYPLLLITNSIMVGHFFALTNNKAINILFISSLFILTSIYLYIIL